MNKRILSLFAVSFAISFAYAQNTFEGTFTLHSESSKKEKPAIDENFAVKNEKVLVVLTNSQMPDKKTKMIINTMEGSTTILVDENGRKMAMKMRQDPRSMGRSGAPGQPTQPGQPNQPGQPDQPGQPMQPGGQPDQPGGQPGQPMQPGQPNQPNQPGQPGRDPRNSQETVTETQETKKIDGYTCKKVLIKTASTSTEAWVTSEVPVNYQQISSSLSNALSQPRPGAGDPMHAPKQPKYPSSLKGFPLLITTTNLKTKEITTTTISEVKKAPVDEKKFDIAGYQVMDMPMMPPPPPRPDEDEPAR